ncbi:arylamine N-acetyltransferase family protein [Actinacidiphila polyblastidii]
MDRFTADAYLARIGAARPAVADADALRELHLRHLLTVPFENLSIHLGEDIVLEESALVAKLLRGRGGFCYELNGAFCALLREIGFEAEMLAARVFGDDGRLGPPYDHMALRVRTATGEEALADVGFGRHSRYPLDWRSRDEQDDPGGVFRIAAAPDGSGDLDVLRDGAAQYRLEQRPRGLGDFESTCWWQRTWPGSHFRQSPVCSRFTGDGRVTLAGRTLVVTGRTGEDGREARAERELAGRDEVLAAYREHFGIALDREPVAVGAASR